jgi:cation:H+ antiporter
MESLGGAIVVFLVSAAFVIAGGVGLARFGDDIADVTGWGKLWVGTLLVGIGTSLPEVVVNISAVWLEKNPGLALGNVFGADMINVFVLAIAALAFGVPNLFGKQGRDTELLILTGLVLVAMAIFFGSFGDVKLIGWTSLGAILIGVGYVYGMRLVYKAGQTDMDLEDIQAPTTTQARNAWIGFLGSAAVVIVAGRFLAGSADAIAEASGISASFIGVLLVSIVTTLPEGSVTIAASLRRSYGIAMGNVYGSCAFNVTIIFLADLFYTEGPLLRAMEPAHFAAAVSALALMAMGYAVLRLCRSQRLGPARLVTAAILAVYVAALFVVYSLGQHTA